MPSARRRRGSVVAVSIFVAVAIAVLGVATIGRARGHGTLSDPFEVIDYCHSSTGLAERTDQATNGTAWGLDVLELSSRSATITVTSVAMVGASQGLSLRRVAFVPGGQINEGVSGRKPWSLIDPRLRPFVQTLPARLRYIQQVASIRSRDDALKWQLAVVLTAPDDATMAAMDGFTIRYRTGSVTRTLRTHDRVALGTQGSRCPY